MIDPDMLENKIKSINLDDNMNRNKILSKQNLEYAFRVFDKDGIGSKSIEEIMSIFIITGNDVNKKVFEKMMRDADKKGDEAIEF